MRLRKSTEITQTLGNISEWSSDGLREWGAGQHPDAGVSVIGNPPITSRRESFTAPEASEFIAGLAASVIETVAATGEQWQDDWLLK